MSSKVWNLMYALGSTGRVVGDSENPQSRKRALDGASVVAENGWRVWVVHHTKGKRIFESPSEIEFRNQQSDQV